MSWVNRELFQKSEAKKPVATQAETDMMRTLKQRADLGLRWTKADEIAQLIGWPVCESSRRKVRKISEINSKRVLTGDNGYCLLSAAQPGEVSHAVNRLRTHAEKVLKRAVDLSNAYHHFSQENPKELRSGS